MLEPFDGVWPKYRVAATTSSLAASRTCVRVSGIRVVDEAPEVPSPESEPPDPATKPAPAAGDPTSPKITPGPATVKSAAEVVFNKSPSG